MSLDIYFKIETEEHIAWEKERDSVLKYANKHFSPEVNRVLEITLLFISNLMHLMVMVNMNTSFPLSKMFLIAVLNILTQL